MLPAVEYKAEQFCGSLDIVHRGMGLFAIPGQAGGLHRAAEHSLAIGQAGEGHGVECAEGMKRISLEMDRVSGSYKPEAKSFYRGE